MKTILFLVCLMTIGIIPAGAISCGPPVIEIPGTGDFSGQSVSCNHISSYRLDESLSGLNVQRSGNTLLLSGSPRAGGYLHVYGNTTGTGPVTVQEAIGIRIGTVPATTTTSTQLPIAGTTAVTTEDKPPVSPLVVVFGILTLAGLVILGYSRYKEW